MLLQTCRNVPACTTVKTAAERGPIGAWAYESRDAADLSPEEVAERLTRMGQPVLAATIRGIEGGSKKPSRRLLKGLATIYGSVPPGEPVPEPVDLGHLVRAINDLVTEMRLARERDQDAAAAMQRAATALATSLRLGGSHRGQLVVPVARRGERLERHPAAQTDARKRMNWSTPFTRTELS